MRVVRVLYTALGVSLGVVGTLLVAPGGREACVPVSVQPGVAHGNNQSDVGGCSEQLEAARRKIETLEHDRANARVVAESAHHADVSAVSPSTAQASPADNEVERRANAIRWRVSAIEKFVPLTDEQRERLKTKYEVEAERGDADGDTETLEQIIGEENARFYRERVRAAFQKVQDEEVDKEVVWLARQLSLSQEQERSVQQIFRSVEQEIVQQKEGGAHAAKNPQERVQALINENRRRAQMRAAQLQGVLTSDQYQAYLQAEAESSTADVEVFHDPQ